MDIAAVPALSPEPMAWTHAPPGDGAIEAAAPAFTIAQLANSFGVTLRTLRFYESVGLLSPRRSGAARLYTQSDYDRIGLIVQGKKLGFTLREIRDLLASPHGDDEGGSLKLSREQCVDQITLLERQRRTIDHALAELRRTYSGHYIQELALGTRAD